MKRTFLAAAALAALALLSTSPVNATALPTSAQVSVAAVGPQDWPVVNQGDKGTDVTTIQYLLNAHGYATGVDGAFGPGTDASVKKFQNDKGLTDDGDVGPKTWAKLIIQVKQGSKGDAVKAAQTQLKANGHSIAVDGDFGSGTDAATKAFQGKVKLTPDGIIGPNTWTALVANATGNPGDPGGGGGNRAELARQLLASPNTLFLRSHVSNNNDYASTAGGNIESTSRGEAAMRSEWGHAGRTPVMLHDVMLRAMVKLDTERHFRYRVTSIAGGRHGEGSKHYQGRAFDVDTINGVRVGSGAPHRAFMNACLAYGARQVFGPDDNNGHETHVHCSW